jgi:uncharacterized coiled-coil protein SlyX
MAPDEPPDVPPPRQTPVVPATTLMRIGADLRLMSQALIEQGTLLATLSSQVARLTVRLDDTDSRHYDIEDKMTQALSALTERTNAMASRLDEIFLALTKVA